MMMPSAGKPPMAASLYVKWPAPRGKVSGVERGRGCLAAGRVGPRDMFGCIRQRSSRAVRPLTSGLCGALVLGALLLTQPESTAHAQSLSPGLVAAYSFDEGTGTTVADASGTGNGGAIGTATWSTLGKNGNALSFNGTSARVTVPDAPSLRLTNAMTLEAWVFPTKRSTVWRDVIFKGDDYFLMSSTHVSSRPAVGGNFSGTNAYLNGPSALTSNRWTHLAATYDGTTLRLYVNGAQVATRSQTGTLATSSNPLNIGGDTIYNQYFAGRIDDVRLYNTARSAVQIQADMNAPVTPPTQSVSSIADSATISEESASPTESATTNQAGTGDSPAGEETKGTEQETDSGNEGANSQETIASERTEASGIGRTQTDTDNSRDTGTNSDSGTNESTGTNEEPGGGVTSSPDTR
jgi:hypothetical protein